MKLRSGEENEVVEVVEGVMDLVDSVHKDLEPLLVDENVQPLILPLQRPLYFIYPFLAVAPSLVDEGNGPFGVDLEGNRIHLRPHQLDTHEVIKRTIT
mmetsp:Transcript_11513/g.11497  ORF Transcript_11513/g.11497 Transcript_11513/m.11497 type:complete len:98 (-) Transcript_11513:210-503(-)